MATATNEQTQTNVEHLAGKYLTFALANEEYGLAILKVQEIIKMMEITKVPKMPVFVRGVINLRGKVIPVMELRTKFELETVEATEKTCVIVVQIAARDKRLTVGIIVDEVSEVLDVAGDQIEPAPEFGAAVDTAFILGMAKIEDRVIMLLDVDKILGAQELASLA